jgi:hypothetical protein
MTDGNARALVFDFFGQAVRVTCDHDAVASALATIYERQRHPGPPPAPADLDVSVSSVGQGGPRVTVGGRTVRAPDAASLLHYAHLVLVNAAAAACQKARVLHGCAVERDGRAIAVLAASGGGKSTVSVEMVRRGWRLLSDDFVVLGPDGVVRPFLRRVNLLDDTLAMLGLQPPPGALSVPGPGGHHKWMVDIEALFPGATGAPASLGALFVVTPAGGTNRSDRPRRWQLELDHRPAGFDDDLRAIEGVESVETGPGRSNIVVLGLAAGARIVAAVDRVCTAHDVAVLSAGAPGARRSKRPARPTALPLPPEHAACSALTHDLGLSGRRFLYGTQLPGVAAALQQLRQALAASGAPAWRLAPGPLAATVDLLEQLEPRARGADQ